MTNSAAASPPLPPSCGPSRYRTARGQPLLVLLHGYGANEQDLLSLADMLPAEFVVASVRAPRPWGRATPGSR